MSAARLPSFRTDNLSGDWAPTRYGKRVDMPLSKRRDSGLCCAKVSSAYDFSYCPYKAKHGSDYCGHHNDAAVERIRKKADETRARWETESEARNRASAARARKLRGFDILHKAITEIASGHNDPRDRAAEALREVDV